MAQDVKVLKNNEGIYDIPISGNDLSSIDGFETAIIVSLFTDARENSANVRDSFNRRGWVGNLLTLKDSFELGSVLWGLVSRLDQNTLNRADNIVKKALKWMIDDSIADNIDITTTKLNERSAQIEIILYKNMNETSRYITLWNNTKAFS